MTNDEAIKRQVELLRKHYNIYIYPDDVQCFCHECDLENYLFSLRNNLHYEQILFSSLGISEPYHRASLIGFKHDFGLQWFLVDPTYGQFFKNKKFCDYMFSNYKDFSLELLNNGYIECTIENIYSYIHGFMFSNAFSDDINTDLIYSNLYNILLVMKEKSDFDTTVNLEDNKPKKRLKWFHKKNKLKEIQL